MPTQNLAFGRVDSQCAVGKKRRAIASGKAAASKSWDLMQAVAKKLAQFDPENAQWWISWAYATRRVDSIEAARLILLNALEGTPYDGMIHVNLACYECLLGNVEDARSLLKR